MKITVESTRTIVEIDEPISARRWEGIDDDGTPLVALIAAIYPQINDPAVNARFAAALNEVVVEEVVVEPETVEEPPDLGPCCICETTTRVRNMIMLDQRGQVPGHGWGCLVCDLPADGASAVLCDPCLDAYRQDPSVLTMACRGYPASDGRVAIADLPPFAHDARRHREERDDAEATGGWKATLFSGQRERPVYGALRTTQRLHWTKEGARAEAIEWCREMKLAPITTWDPADDKWEIGRNQTHYVIVRRILLPLGQPPGGNDHE